MMCSLSCVERMREKRGKHNGFSRPDRNLHSSRRDVVGGWVDGWIHNSSLAVVALERLFFFFFKKRGKKQKQNKKE